MKNSKENGITLIALIITIIVLLILAGISISLVVGDNGVLGQAVNASTATDIAETKEQIELALIGYYDETGHYTEDDVESAVQDVLGSDAEINEETDGVYTVTTEKGNTVDISDLFEYALEGEVKIIYFSFYYCYENTLRENVYAYSKQTFKEWMDSGLGDSQGIHITLDYGNSGYTTDVSYDVTFWSDEDCTIPILSTDVIKDGGIYYVR